MHAPKLLICLLCGPERYQWPAPHLIFRFIEAARLRDVDVEVRLIFGVYGYAEARNYAGEMFLSSDAAYVLTLDNDNVPPAGFISRVLDFIALAVGRGHFGAAVLLPSAG